MKKNVKKIVLLVFLCSVWCCNPNGKRNNEKNVKYNTIIENSNINFNIGGVWVRKDYIEDLKITLSPSWRKQK